MANRSFYEQSKDLGFDLRPEEQRLFDLYREMIQEWNEKINITRITSSEEIDNKHFLDSLSVFRLIDLPCQASLVDIGSGGGFPGIPMKIWNPDFSLTMVDSLQKRIRFLDAVIEKLNLKDTQAIHARAEDIFQKPDYREQFDIAVSRALAPLPTLVEYALPSVKVGGYFIAMKGPNGDKELEEAKKAIEILGGEVSQLDRFTWTDNNYQRMLIKIKKVKKCPSDYPRGQGKARKRPL